MFGCSIQNWISDLYWKQIDIDYPGIDDAMVCALLSFELCFIINASFSFKYTLSQVHHGFYSAYHNTTLRPGILSAVERAKSLYGDLKIMVTGHSMGGAMAAFCALDLTVSKTSKNFAPLFSALLCFCTWVMCLFD